MRVYDVLLNDNSKINSNSNIITMAAYCVMILSKHNNVNKSFTFYPKYRINILNYEKM